MLYFSNYQGIISTIILFLKQSGIKQVLKALKMQYSSVIF